MSCIKQRVLWRWLKFKHVRINTQFFINKFQFLGGPSLYLLCYQIQHKHEMLSVCSVAGRHTWTGTMTRVWTPSVCPRGWQHPKDQTGSPDCMRVRKGRVTCKPHRSSEHGWPGTWTLVCTWCDIYSCPFVCISRSLSFSPGLHGSFGWALSCKRRGCRFDSRSGRISELQALCSVFIRVLAGGRR